MAQGMFEIPLPEFVRIFRGIAYEGDTVDEL